MLVIGVPVLGQRIVFIKHTVLQLETLNIIFILKINFLFLLPLKIMTYLIRSHRLCWNAF